MPGISPASIAARRFQFANEVAEIPSSFATESMDLPLERYRATARSLNSRGYASFLAITDSIPRAHHEKLRAGQVWMEA